MNNKKIRDYVLMPALLIVSVLIIISGIKTFEFLLSTEFSNGNLQVDAFLILLIAAPFWFLLKYVWDKVETINFKQHVEQNWPNHKFDELTGEYYEKDREIILSSIPERKVAFYIETVINTCTRLNINDVECIDSRVGIRRVHLTLKSGTKNLYEKICNIRPDLELALTKYPLIIKSDEDSSIFSVLIPIEKWGVVEWTKLQKETQGTSVSDFLIAIGRKDTGELFEIDLLKCPNILISGTTGSGKGMIQESIINTLFLRLSPSSLKFIFIDPKRVQLAHFTQLPHTILPVAEKREDVLSHLQFATQEIKRRKKLFADESISNLQDYNALKNETPPIPYIIIVIDELSDLMLNQSKEMQFLLNQIALTKGCQGILTIISTSIPGSDVITKQIKDNFPVRIIGKVASKVDAETLGIPGAEKLLGVGDAYFIKSLDSEPVLIQGNYIDELTIKNNILKKY